MQQNNLTNQSVTMKEFLLKVFETLHANQPMINNWHLDLMLEYLRAMENGNLRRLIVNLPPRSLKSICINVAWPAWILGNAPHSRIITVSYNQSLSEKHAVDCRSVMQSEWYREMFPNTILKHGMNTKNRFYTTKNGFRLSTSPYGTLTGEGADLIIIDDPISACDAFSARKRKKIYEWFKGCLLSRLNDFDDGKIILIMQRLHADDLTGMLLKNNINNTWQVLKISAISTTNHVFSFGLFKYHRAIGEQLYDNAYIIDKNGSIIYLNITKPLAIITQFSIDKPLISSQTFNSSIYKLQYSIPNNAFIWQSYDVQNLYESIPFIFTAQMLLKLESIYERFYRYNLDSLNTINNLNVLSKLSVFRLIYVKKNIYNIKHFCKNYTILCEMFKQSIMHQSLYRLRSSQLNIKGINRNFYSLKNELGNNLFNIQYQQEVSERINAIIKPEWINTYYDYIPISDYDLLKEDREKFDYINNFDYVYQSWDCAIKNGINNDYSVCTTWGSKNDKLYLLHVFRQKIDYPKLRANILRMRSYFDPDIILIEDCAAGQQIIQELSSNIKNIIAIRPCETKIVRLLLVSPLFEKGIILFPKIACWLDELLNELLNFPDCEYDDQVDSISQFLIWYQKYEYQSNTQFSIKCC